MQNNRVALKKIKYFQSVEHQNFILFILTCSYGQAQDSFRGFSVGLSFNFGNKVNRVGLHGGLLQLCLCPSKY